MSGKLPSREVLPGVPLSVSTRIFKKHGLVVLEIQSPVDLIPLISSAMNLLQGLGTAVNSELRGVERLREAERRHQEHLRLKKRLLEAYLDYRRQGHLHLAAVKLVAKDPRFSDQHKNGAGWIISDFRDFLPSALEADALLKKGAARRR